MASLQFVCLFCNTRIFFRFASKNPSPCGVLECVSLQPTHPCCPRANGRCTTIWTSSPIFNPNTINHVLHLKYYIPPSCAGWRGVYILYIPLHSLYLSFSLPLSTYLYLSLPLSTYLHLSLSLSTYLST